MYKLKCFFIRFGRADRTLSPRPEPGPARAGLYTEHLGLQFLQHYLFKNLFADSVLNDGFIANFS